MLKLMALDGLDVIGEIVDFLKVDITERDLRAGSWSVELPDTSIARRMRNADWPGLAAYDPETGWWWGGFVTEEDLELDRGRLTFSFSGLDFQAELANRPFLPSMPNLDQGTWNPNYAVNNLSLTSAAFNIAYFTFGPAAQAGWEIPGLEFDADPNGGPVEPWLPSFSNCLELWRAQFTDRDWTVRLRYDQRQTVVDSVPRLEFSTPQRATSPLLFSTQTGEITSARVSERAALSTDCISAGDWVDETDQSQGRLFARDVTPATSWRTRRTYSFVDRPGLDQTQIDVENEAYHRSQGQRKSVEIDSVNVGGWGRDIDIGWLARVQLGEGPYAETDLLPVNTMRLTFDVDQGWQRGIGLGVANPKGQSFVYHALTRIAERVNRLDRGR